MDYAHLRQRCLALNASERIVAVVRLFARMSMPPLGVVVVDRLLIAGAAGMSLDELSTLLGLPAAIVQAEIDGIRVRFLETVGGDPGVKPSDGSANSVRYVVDFRKALPAVHASISLAFTSIFSIPAGDVPQRLAAGLSESGATVGDKKAAVPCVCCPKCALAVAVSSLVSRLFCRSCGGNVGMDGAARCAAWVLADESVRPARDALPFVCPDAFLADKRLAIYAALFGALFEEKFCCLSPAPVVSATSDFLTPDEARRFSKQSGSLTLRYAVPRQLRIAVCTREELRERAAEESGAPQIDAPATLPPWLAEPGSAPTRAGDAVARRKVHRPELVCAAQLPQPRNGDTDEDEDDFVSVLGLAR